MQTNKDEQHGKSTARGAPSLIGSATSSLGPGLQIKGEITGNEDLKLDSKVEGLVSIGGFRLTVGPGARVVGDIVSREAVISGEVIGDISARDRIEIRKSASVEGDLSTGKILIEDGAYFKGAIEIDGNHNRIGTDLDTLLSGVKKEKKA